MSGAVSIHVPEVRLAKLIRTPGGKPVADAMRDANKGLESLQALFERAVRGNWRPGSPHEAFASPRCLE